MQNIKEFWFNLSDKIRFVIIGCFNAAVSYGFYILFCLLLGTSHYQMSLLLSWVFSSFISFSAQKYLVFESKGNWLKEYSKCAMTWALSYLLNALFLEICIKTFDLNVFIAQIVSTLAVAVVTYVLFKNFAFKNLS